jgi:hypothetical protein
MLQLLATENIPIWSGRALALICDLEILKKKSLEH